MDQEQWVQLGDDTFRLSELTRFEFKRSEPPTLIVYFRHEPRGVVVSGEGAVRAYDRLREAMRPQDFAAATTPVAGVDFVVEVGPKRGFCGKLFRASANIVTEAARRVVRAVGRNKERGQ